MKPTEAMFAEERRRGARRLRLAIVFGIASLLVVAHAYYWMWSGTRVLKSSASTGIPRQSQGPGPKRFIVLIQSSGEVLVEGKPMSEENLKAAILQSGPNALLRLEQDAKYAIAEKVLRELSHAGATNICVSIQPLQSTSTRRLPTDNH